MGALRQSMAALGARNIREMQQVEMVYAPAETKLMKIARGLGMEIISGAEMFVHQGARQFEIWTGKPAPVEDMHRVVVTALANRAAAAAAKK